MIFKTNKNGITIGGKTVDEISEDFDKLSNYISEREDFKNIIGFICCSR